MAARSRVLTPYVSARHFLGSELRRWRLHRGMSLPELGRATFISSALLGKVEKTERQATTALVVACDTALDTGGALQHLLGFAHNFMPIAAPRRREPVASVVIQILADADGGEDGPPLPYPEGGRNGARVIQLADVRRRRQ